MNKFQISLSRLRFFGKVDFSRECFEKDCFLECLDGDIEYRQGTNWHIFDDYVPKHFHQLYCYVLIAGSLNQEVEYDLRSSFSSDYLSVRSADVRDIALKFNYSLPVQTYVDHGRRGAGSEDSLQALNSEILDQIDNCRPHGQISNKSPR